MDINDYYLALGKFVDRFAGAEDAAFLALSATIGLDSTMGAAVFSGTRVREAIKSIKRIWEVKEQEPQPELLDAFSHLLTINTVRDKILHHGVRQLAGILIVSTAIRAHAERTNTAFPVSALALEEMTDDLDTICTRLLLYTAATNSPETFAASDGDQLQGLIRISQRPWRYKFPG